jgi:hypothetical protein
VSVVRFGDGWEGAVCYGCACGGECWAGGEGVGRVPLRADRRGEVVRELESGLVGVLDGDGEIDGEELCACGAYGRVFHRLRC